MQVKVKIKRLQQLLLQSNVNSSKNCATYGNEAKLDYAKLDALKDENDDKSRTKRSKWSTVQERPAVHKRPEFLRLFAAMQYFDAIKVLEQNPNAKNAALQILVNANVSIYKAYSLSNNKTALLYRWWGHILLIVI